MGWEGRRVLVTGGASFIGSHLTEALLTRGAQVRVVDNLGTGRLEHIRQHVETGDVEFLHGNLLDQAVVRRATDGMETVFHLAADHGGRGYVDRHQAACAGNLALDGMLFLACLETGVEKIVYASSACVYPSFEPSNASEVLYLSEDMVGPPHDAENMYGWAKLMGEKTLAAYCREWGMKGASCRFSTVYGERGKEDHAVIAMIARAFACQDPFEVWGNGEQVRNWTYVGDIVEGTILAAQKIDDGTAVNLGTAEGTRVIDAAREILRHTGSLAEIKLLTEMPTGPASRVADNSLARRLLGWEPKVKFIDGLRRTIDWYFATHGVTKAVTSLPEPMPAR